MRFTLKTLKSKEQNFLYESRHSDEKKTSQKTVKGYNNENYED